jgi:acetylornithine/succinyldiaminopimelate/putrescine aminotransferase
VRGSPWSSNTTPRQCGVNRWYWCAGRDAGLWDVDGKEYLDLVAGWAVNNLGHAHPVVTRAIAEQAATLERLKEALKQL